MLNRLRRDGWAEVERWNTERERETHHLEFKRKASPHSAKVEDEDRKTISKAISALANTGGGLLVIGVHADGGGKPGAEFDRVRSLQPIADAEALGAALEQLVPSLTDPPVEGLEVETFTPPGHREGIVAVSIPRSDGGPHRVVGSSSDVNDRYYMRTASGAHPMPHPLLADRFGRAALPKLRLLARPGALNPLTLVLSLENLGRGAARRPAVILRDARLVSEHGKVIWPAGRNIDGTSRFGMTALPYGEAALDGWFFEPFEGDVVVYPGVRRGLFTLQTDLVVVPEAFIPFRFEFRAELHALDAAPVRGRGCLTVATATELTNDSEFSLEGRPGE